MSITPIDAIGSIYNEVVLSKKYAALCEPLIMRICREEYPKYKKDKDRIKSIKNKLHIIYGAFQSGETHKKAASIIEGLDNSIIHLKEASADIMRLHTSSNERVDSLDKFYGFIFDTIGHSQIRSILDIGCGFNPFSLDFMPADIVEYHAYDIDYRTIELLNRYFKLRGLPSLAATADIISETPQDIADAAFVFKLMPVIEIQSPGRGFALLRELNTRYIVVTYPIKSLCGKNKGMEINYAQTFECGSSEDFEIIAQSIIGDELVYIIRK